jgi:glutamate/tyrosine decarboxylase-like PLP-dependent enzyme
MRQAALAMDAATFRALGHRLVDQLAGFLEALPHGPVTHDESPSAVRDALALTGPLPEIGMEPGPLLERTAQLLFDHLLFNGHPRFFGYITAPPAPIGPQNSRGFRALKVWLALRHVGAAAYRKMIADDIRLSRLMAEAVGRHAELELMTQDLSITTFRYVPRDLRTNMHEAHVERHLDALNRALLDRLQRGGEVFVSNAVIAGRYALRACIVNFHTARADVEALPEIVARVGRKVDAELRTTS